MRILVHKEMDKVGGCMPLLFPLVTALVAGILQGCKGSSSKQGSNSYNTINYNNSTINNYYTTNNN